MVVILSVKNETIYSEAMKGMKCPRCFHEGRCEFEITQTRVSFLGIPMAAGRMCPQIFCHICQQDIDTPADEDFEGDKLARLVRSQKTGLAPWSGTIAIALGLIIMIGFLSMSGRAAKNKEANTLALLQAPKVGDLYRVLLLRPDGGTDITIAKVEAVSSQSTEIKFHKDHRPSTDIHTVKINNFASGESNFETATTSVITEKIKSKTLSKPGEFRALGTVDEVVRP